MSGNPLSQILDLPLHNMSVYDECIGNLRKRKESKGKKSLVAAQNLWEDAHFISLIFSHFFCSADHGLSCICNMDFSQNCLDNPFCSISGDFAHCLIEVSLPDMVVNFQGCGDSLVTFLTCNGQVFETGNGRLVLCCLTNNCNSVEAINTQVSQTGAPTPYPVLTTPRSFPTATLQASLSVLEESPNSKLKAYLTNIYVSFGSSDGGISNTALLRSVWLVRDARTDRLWCHLLH